MNMEKVNILIEKLRQNGKERIQLLSDLEFTIKEKEGYKTGTDDAELEADGDLTIYPVVEKLEHLCGRRFN
jgi:hypothetical protein